MSPVVLCNDILAFFSAQQLAAVVSVHIMVDFLSLFLLTAGYGDDSDDIYFG